MLNRVFEHDFPTLEVGNAHLLRELRDTDAPAYFAYYQEPDVGRYILATDPKTELEALTEIRYCRNLFRAKRGLYWSLADKQSEEMIGAVGLYTNNFHHRAELCYDLNKHYWRQGIMSAAIKSTLAFCFRDADIQRVEAVTMIDNEASQQILLSLGFEYEGILKAYRYYEGDFHDIKMFAMTKAMHDTIAPPPSEDDLDKLMNDMSK